MKKIANKKSDKRDIDPAKTEVVKYNWAKQAGVPGNYIYDRKRPSSARVFFYALDRLITDKAASPTAFQGQLFLGQSLKGQVIP